MEYKIRHVKKKKAQKTKNRENAGFIRIKIRGRKRWVKGKTQKQEEKQEQ